MNKAGAKCVLNITKNRIKFGSYRKTFYLCIQKSLKMKWFEELPPSCPPADAVPCDGQYYRIAKGNPAEDSDFFSQRKMQPDKVFKGLGVDDCIARALSVFADKSDATRRLKLPKFRDAKIAEVTLEPKDGLMKQTFSASHYSWWRSMDFDVLQAKIIEI